MDHGHSSVLLRRARDGSTEAMDAVMNEVGQKLLALIRLRLGPGLRARLESRDILQATLLKGFERFEQFEGSSSRSLMGWMAAIAHNEIRDQAEFHGRRRRDLARQVPLDAVAPGGEAAAHLRSEVSRIALERDFQLLAAALERLEERYREVILLRRFEELGFAEIGQRMGRSAEACRKLLARAMTALSEEILALRRSEYGS